MNEEQIEKLLKQMEEDKIDMFKKISDICQDIKYEKEQAKLDLDHIRGQISKDLQAKAERKDMEHVGHMLNAKADFDKV